MLLPHNYTWAAIPSFMRSLSRNSPDPVQISKPLLTEAAATNGHAAEWG